VARNCAMLASSVSTGPQTSRSLGYSPRVAASALSQSSIFAADLFVRIDVFEESTKAQTIAPCSALWAPMIIHFQYCRFSRISGARRASPRLRRHALRLGGAGRRVVCPQIEGTSAREIEAGVVPVAGQGAVLDVAAIQPKARWGAAIIEREDTIFVVDDEYWTVRSAGPAQFGQ
jgi:hypothetical protein